jgi:hypothetical protein
VGVEGKDSHAIEEETIKGRIEKKEIGIAPPSY